MARRAPGPAEQGRSIGKSGTCGAVLSCVPISENSGVRELMLRILLISVLWHSGPSLSGEGGEQSEPSSLKPPPCPGL